jgi:hypothetical protein
VLILFPLLLSVVVVAQRPAQVAQLAVAVVASLGEIIYLSVPDHLMMYK